MAAADKREINEQLSSSHGSFELVASPVLLGLGGWWLDGKLGTGPVFLVTAAVFGLLGALVKTYYGYRYRMAAASAAADASRDARVAEAAAQRKANADALAAEQAALATELAQAEARSVLTKGSA